MIPLLRTFATPTTPKSSSRISSHMTPWTLLTFAAPTTLKSSSRISSHMTPPQTSLHFRCSHHSQVKLPHFIAYDTPSPHFRYSHHSQVKLPHFIAYDTLDPSHFRCSHHSQVKLLHFIAYDTPSLHSALSLLPPLSIKLPHFIAYDTPSPHFRYSHHSQVKLPHFIAYDTPYTSLHFRCSHHSQVKLPHFIAYPFPPLNAPFLTTRGSLGHYFFASAVMLASKVIYIKGILEARGRLFINFTSKWIHDGYIMFLIRRRFKAPNTMPQQAQGEDFTQDIENVDSSPSADSGDSDSDQSNDDSDLLRVRAAIAAPPVNASAEDLRKASLYFALEIAQRLLLDMRGKYRESLKKNSLLEATLSKGRKTKLTNKDLALAAKEDTIKNYGRKFSVTHCLWVETTIFPLRAPPPNIDLTSKERWLSPISVQDGVKAELFLFVLPADHSMMAHRNFGSHFVKGINSVRAEMVSDVKSCAAAIFGLDAKFFIRGYARDSEPACRALLLNPQGAYTKFAPVLFPRPDHMSRDDFLKTSKLVYILKVSLFGRSSLAANAPPTPKTKAKIWELRTITPGLIAAAAIVAIFILSGDKELVEIGEKSRIAYKEYHNYYRQSLMTGGAWAASIYSFFNNSLFTTSPSAATLLSSDLGDERGPHDTWEQDFERAMEMGGDLTAPPSTVSISAAMQGLDVSEDRELPPTDALHEGSQPPVGMHIDEPNISALVQKPKPKPKPRRKTKAGAGAEDLSGAADEDLTTIPPAQPTNFPEATCIGGSAGSRELWYVCPISLRLTHLNPTPLQEFGINIIGEDNKTIIHHKVAARVMCVFTDEDAHLAAHVEAIPTSASLPPNIRLSSSQHPPLFLPTSASIPPSIRLSSSQHLGELQKSRDTGAELHSLSSSMNDIHNTLGASAPKPTTLPPIAPSHAFTTSLDHLCTHTRICRARKPRTPAPPPEHPGLSPSSSSHADSSRCPLFADVNVLILLRAALRAT
ncbi:hypothetical protein DEU56DRAFT_955177 [Suillus clintonianus]|uniref:uncharacterized protein n=1 Tax=Suillus clintonianus TaxID=1904413 RepID=UPI001B869A33|nr:uncharacterized protein DEU56DRAFT_955177 [Suillus clintonianus]KAG2153245.1 hypothetical protein DEU56DRAFT_955177 [Suillus clintonianus]